MKMRMLVIAAAGVTLVALFQNCSKQGLQINDLAAKSGTDVDLSGTPAPSPSPSPSPSATPPPSVNDLIKNCDDAKARGKIAVSTTQITFEDNIGECQWGVGDNMSMRNGFLRARAEQVRKINIPSGATVCQVHLEDVAQQNFRYDDNILLTLNNYLLAATASFQSYLSNNNGYYLYEWSRMVDKDGNVNPADTTVDHQYCAGGAQGLSSCQFPLTETVGSVQLQFNERVIQNILGMTSAKDINLTMITTGDNDSSSDCHHNPIRFNVEVEYYY